MIMRPPKAIRKPGKNSPGVFAFSDPRPLLRDFTKNIDAKAKPSTSTSPILSLRAESFTKPMSSEPAPSHRPWISTLGATPASRALPYHAGLQTYTRRTGFFCRLKVLSCRMRCSAVKQHWNTGMDTKRCKPGNAIGRPSS